MWWYSCVINNVLLHFNKYVVKDTKLRYILNMDEQVYLFWNVFSKMNFIWKEKPS